MILGDQGTRYILKRSVRSVITRLCSPLATSQGRQPHSSTVRYRLTGMTRVSYEIFPRTRERPSEAISILL